MLQEFEIDPIDAIDLLLFSRAQARAREALLRERLDDLAGDGLMSQHRWSKPRETAWDSFQREMQSPEWLARTSARAAQKRRGRLYVAQLTAETFKVGRSKRPSKRFDVMRRLGFHPLKMWISDELADAVAAETSLLSQLRSSFSTHAGKETFLGSFDRAVQMASIEALKQAPPK